MDITQATTALKKYQHSIHPLQPEEWTDMAAAWQPFTAKRKTLLTKAGETENHLYFVTEGMQRAFHLHSNDKEATIVFKYHAPHETGRKSSQAVLQNTAV